MMRAWVVVTTVVCWLFVVGALAQAPPPAAAPVVPKPAGGVAVEAGAAPAEDPAKQEAARKLVMQLLTDPDLDIAQTLPLMMLLRAAGGEGGGGGGEELGMALMMKGMSGGGSPGTLLRDGDVVFLVSRGVV